MALYLRPQPNKKPNKPPLRLPRRLRPPFRAAPITLFSAAPTGCLTV